MSLFERLGPALSAEQTGRLCLSQENDFHCSARFRVKRRARSMAASDTDALIVMLDSISGCSDDRPHIDNASESLVALIPIAVKRGVLLSHREPLTSSRNQSHRTRSRNM